MNKGEKRILVLLVLFFMVELIVFKMAISEMLELILIIISIILTICAYFYFAAFNNNRFYPIRGLICLIGIGVTFGFGYWFGHNNDLRYEKKLKAGINSKGNNSQQIEDSIQHVKDSLRMIADSKRLYELEGDTIFGPFCFGMTRQQVDGIKEKIQIENRGLISFAGHDFILDECKYDKDRLYYMRLKYANAWVRDYNPDTGEYEDGEGFGDGADIVNSIKQQLSKKYGNPDISDSWHFTYKDIWVFNDIIKVTKEDYSFKQWWSVFITFSNPPIAMEVGKEENKFTDKVDEDKTILEKEIKNNKE